MSDPTRTDEELLERLRSGETRALATLAVRHWRLVARVASLIADPMSSADLVAAAFLGLCEETSVRPREPVWIALVRRVVDRAMTAPDDGRFSALRAAISSLEELDRLAFALWRIERLPENEVAEILHIPREEVRRRAGRLELQLAHRLWERRVGARARRRSAA